MRMPHVHLPCPQQRAGYRGKVEVGEEVMGDLQRGSIVESATECRGLVVVVLLVVLLLLGGRYSGTGAIG